MRLLFLLLLFSFLSIRGQAGKKPEAVLPVRFFRSYEDFRQHRFVPALDTAIAANEAPVIGAAALNNAIWGMQKEGQLYRMIGENWYEVADTSGIIIYSNTSIKAGMANYTTWVPVPIGKSFPHGFPMNINNEADVTERTYFFSRDLEDTVLAELEIANIIARINYPPFTAELSKTFRWYKNEITSYNHKKHQYLVNVIYNKYRAALQQAR